MNVGKWYSIKVNGQIVDALYTGVTNDGKHVLRYSQNGKLNVCTYSEDELKDVVVNDKRVYNGVVKHVPKDTEINKLFLSWIWYIFLMIIISIFKGNFIGWAFISFFFFSWRKKVKEEATYYTKE
nr:MAG TPA: hypothetical protein [Caudoviricetes sp.]